MDLLQVINDLQTQYKDLFNRFIVVDENDPIDPKNIKDAARWLNDWYKSIKEQLISFENESGFHNNENKIIKNTFENKLKELREKLANYNVQIKKEHDVEKQSSLEQIKQEKENLNDIKDNLVLDNEYTLKSSEQSKEIIIRDFESEKKRYDYQLDSSIASYEQIVESYNNMLDIKIKDIDNDYQLLIKEYVNDYDNIIEKFQILINHHNKDLQALNTQLGFERNRVKENYLEESKFLNENIKRITEEKNNLIDKSKKEHSKALSDSNIERENNRQKYLNDSQILLKTFVTNISKTDEEIASLKNRLSIETDNIKREHFYNVYKKTNDYHKTINRLRLTKSRKNERLIKTCTRIYQRTINYFKKETLFKLTQITKNYIREIEELKDAKNYLEIDKNYALKHLAELEQYDNKYYQELSDVFENNDSTNIKNANFHFSQQANILRCQSQIRNKLLERNFDGLEANYYKQIETTKNKINIYNLEINLTNTLKESVKSYREKLYYNELHYEEVLNLLEIEKNKLLLDFNKEKYNLNIRSITCSLNYANDKIDISNRKQIKTAELKLFLETAESNKRISTYNLDIKLDDLIEQYLKIRLNGKYKFEIDKAKLSYFYSLYKNDLSYMYKITDLYTDIYIKLQSCYQSFISIIFKGIIVNDNTDLRYIAVLYNNIYEIFLSTYQNINNSYIDIINEILANRITFIEETNYTPSYNETTSTFESQTARIKERVALLLDQNDSHLKTIENFRQKIYTLINENEMLKKLNKVRSKKLPQDISNQIKSNQNKLKEYRRKIDEYTINREKNNNEISQCNFIQTRLNNEYNLEINKIKKMQYSDTKDHLNYQSKIKIKINELNRISSILHESGSLSDLTKKNFLKKITKSHTMFINLLVDTKNLISQLLSEFENNTIQSNHIRENIITNEQNKFDKDYLNKQTKAFKQHDKEKNKTLSEHDNIIRNAKNNLNEAIISFENLLLNRNNIFKKEGLYLKKLLVETTNDFYKKCDALLSNRDAIKKHFKDERDSIENQHTNTKNLSVKETINNKNQANKRLNQLLKAKDEEIDHLPIAYRYNTNLLNKDTKNKNAEISLLIKHEKGIYNDKKKVIDKKLSLLKQQFNQARLATEAEHQKDLKLEKKKNKYKISASIKNIKITL